MAVTIDQVAAHEAGHAVVAMAFGVRVKAIRGMVGNPSDSFLVGVFETFSTEFDMQTMRLLEARPTYMIAVGGFAGEIAHEGIVEPRGALDDLIRLRKVNLNDFQIQLLTGVAMEIIEENRQLWEEIYNAVLVAIQHSQTAFIPGDAMSQRFEQIGKRFTDTAKLEALLPDD
jgi:hypothetical protein